MNWVKKLAGFLIDLLAPEEQRLNRLLSLDEESMKRLLPSSPVRINDVFVLFDYRNKIVKMIIKSIKYKNNLSMKNRIAGYLCDEIIEISSDVALFDGSPPLLVGMPMSKNEKLNRGFNQTEELVFDIRRLSGNNIEISTAVLEKFRETKRQTSLGKKERAQNVKNSMAANPRELAKIKNRTIIVLDDVYTTLASFNEAKRALLADGAKRVIGLFIAH